MVKVAQQDSCSSKGQNRDTSDADDAILGLNLGVHLIRVGVFDLNALHSAILDEVQTERPYQASGFFQTARSSLKSASIKTCDPVAIVTFSPEVTPPSSTSGTLAK